MSSYKELKTQVQDEEEELEERRRRIHQWMADKYAQRQSEYQQHRMDLREKEVNPYKPSAQVGGLCVRVCVCMCMCVCTWMCV